ncbi:MAG TPA: uL22 family ribosomal protein, partial [Gemmata sp.]|nr:uL22 family ribosomal protein [Gemmata sp.]
PDPDDLVIAECRVDGAPMFKRIQPRARGTAFQIKRRMSHIIVALADPEDLLPAMEQEVPETTAAEPTVEQTAPEPTPAPAESPAGAPAGA